MDSARVRIASRATTLLANLWCWAWWPFTYLLCSKDVLIALQFSVQCDVWLLECKVWLLPSVWTNLWSNATHIKVQSNADLQPLDMHSMETKFKQHNNLEVGLANCSWSDVTSEASFSHHSSLLSLSSMKLSQTGRSRQFSHMLKDFCSHGRYSWCDFCETAAGLLKNMCRASKVSKV